MRISRCYLLVQEMSTTGSSEILGNNLAGSVRLKDFTTYLKWSEVGDLQIHLLEVSVFSDCVHLQQWFIGVGEFNGTEMWQKILSMSFWNTKRILYGLFIISFRHTSHGGIEIWTSYIKQLYMYADGHGGLGVEPNNWNFWIFLVLVAHSLKRYFLDYALWNFDLFSPH